MKKLYYSSCSVSPPHMGVIMDDILSCRQPGDDIYLMYCQGALPSCIMNLSGHDSYCRFCHYMYRQYEKKYLKGVTMLPLTYGDLSHPHRELQLDSPDDVRTFKYRNVELGVSLLSMYYDITRDLDISNWAGLSAWARPLLGSLCDLVDYLYQRLAELKPDQVLIYNGRQFENRFLYDITKAMGIGFVALEAVGGHVEPYKRIRFEGEWPLNIELYERMVERLWATSPHSLEEKTRRASSFYEKRRNGVLVGDTKVYTAMQHEGQLPEGFDRSRQNIAIFNSSQDEIAALGEEWQADNLFASQFEAIEFMLQNAAPSLHFYLRIHPNLKGINHKEHLELYDLRRYPNITVIPPESTVSSYALMDACDKVVTFGSTTGVEACFWGKPSILVGRSYYEELGGCYHVRSKAELTEALNGPLVPKDRLGALKYAYFLMDRQYAVEQSTIDIDVKYRHFRWEFFSTSYFKVLGSDWLFQLCYFLFCILGTKFTPGKQPFPWPKH